MLLSLLSGCGSQSTALVASRPDTDTKTLVAQAQKAERSRDYNRARVLYQQAIDEAGDAQSAAFAAKEMASALVFWGEYQGAMDALLLSLKHREDQAPVWHDLGILRAGAGLLPAARTALERAVNLAPNSPRARVALAALLVKMKHYDLALQHYKRLLKMKIPAKIEQATHRAIELLESELQSQQRTVAPTP